MSNAMLLEADAPRRACIACSGETLCPMHAFIAVRFEMARAKVEAILAAKGR